MLQPLAGGGTSGKKAIEPSWAASFEPAITQSKSENLQNKSHRFVLLKFEATQTLEHIAAKVAPKSPGGSTLARAW